MLLETYSAAYDDDQLLATLPQFLIIVKEVTGDPAFSMYNLSLKEDWKTSKKYYSGADSNGKLATQDFNVNTSSPLKCLTVDRYLQLPLNFLKR